MSCHLTPIGKITVIKTFILSKLNHLLLSLPNPNPYLLSKINSILYSFLWSNKPDKIKRDVVRLPPLAGGLKMIDIDLFMKSMKTRLGQLGANISPDRSSLTPQVLIGNFLKHNYPLLYELQHINLLCLYLPKEDGVSPDAEYITQIIFSIFLQ